MCIQDFTEENSLSGRSSHKTGTFRSYFYGYFWLKNMKEILYVFIGGKEHGTVGTNVRKGSKNAK